jgi:hypothetical protein
MWVAGASTGGVGNPNLVASYGTFRVPSTSNQIQGREAHCAASDLYANRIYIYAGIEINLNQLNDMSVQATMLCSGQRVRPLSSRLPCLFAIRLQLDV